MERKLVYVGFAYSHHKGTHAGYHQIKDYLNYDYIVDTSSYINKQPENPNFIEKIMFKLFGFYVFPWYLLKVLWLSWTQKNVSIHFIYGENIYFSIKKMLNRKTRVVCTYHQPYEWFLTKGSYSHQLEKLKDVDEIILVGNTELSIFSGATGKDNVHYIPHGICTDFYKPEGGIKKEHILLTVGNWLRDYEFANIVYQKLLEIDKDLEIYIVTLPKNKAKITENPRIHFLSGITDEELKNLYCRCSVLFLPLIRYTANNSLLEAGATGCNIVISSDNPDNSYIPNDLLTLVPMEVNATVRKIQNAINSQYNNRLADYVKNNYSWEIIGDITKKILRQ